jgi:hypothetical protein
MAYELSDISKHRGRGSMSVSHPPPWGCPLCFTQRHKWKSQPLGGRHHEQERLRSHRASDPAEHRRGGTAQGVGRSVNPRAAGQQRQIQLIKVLGGSNRRVAPRHSLTIRSIRGPPVRAGGPFSFVLRCATAEAPHQGCRLQSSSTIKNDAVTLRRNWFGQIVANGPNFSP